MEETVLLVFCAIILLRQLAICVMTKSRFYSVTLQEVIPKHTGDSTDIEIA